MQKNVKLLTTSLLTLAVSIAISNNAFAQNYNNGSYKPAYTNQAQYQPNYNNNVQYQQQYQQNYNNQYQQPQQGYNSSYGQSYNQPYNQQLAPNQLQGRVVTVPMGTHLPPASSTRDLSSEYLTTGDTVSINLDMDFFFNGTLIAPRGSQVVGDVVVAERAGLAGKHGKLKLKFTSIRTPDGRAIPISGKIATEDGSGLLVGGTTKDRLTKVAKESAVGAGLGALSGTVFGALSGGSTGRGAALGTAVGGGMGIAKSAINKGKNAILASGSRIEIELDQPTTVGEAGNTNSRQNLNPLPSINQLPTLNY